MGLRDQNNGKKIGISGPRIYHVTTLGVVNDSAVLNLHHDNDVKVVVSSQLSITWYKSANQKIGIRTVNES